MLYAISSYVLFLARVSVATRIYVGSKGIVKLYGVRIV